MENCIKNDLFIRTLESHLEGVLIFNSEGLMHFGNNSAMHLLGYFEQDNSQLEWDNIFYDGDKEAPSFLSLIANVNGCCELGDYKYLCKLKNGKVIPVKLRIIVTEIDSEKFVIAYVKEYSEKSSNKGELDALLPKIFHECLNDIYIINAETLRFINANNGVLMKIGYTLEELQDLSPWDLKPDLDDLTYLQLIDPLFTGEFKKVIFESEFRCKDSSIYPVEIHLQLFEDGDRKIYMETVLDLSEKKRMEREHMNTLIQAQESEKERIAKELHDDLGQSLTAIQLMTWGSH